MNKPRPRRATSATPDSDHIPAEIRRAVWKRDGGCCQWKLANGEICGSRYRLQFDHVEPKARGGKTTIANVRLLCQRHNLLAARQAFGEKLMRQYRRGARRPSMPDHAERWDVPGDAERATGPERLAPD